MVNQVMLSQKMIIQIGKEIRGIIGLMICLRLKNVKSQWCLKNRFIDIGVNKEELRSWRRRGNMVTPYSEFEVLANDKYLTAKTF